MKGRNMKGAETRKGRSPKGPKPERVVTSKLPILLIKKSNFDFMFPLFQICKTYYPMVLAFIVQQLFAKKRQSSELFWNKLEISTFTPR